jgi:hypothetical protein
MATTPTFIEGNSYSDSNTPFGLRPYDVQNDNAAPSEPTIKLICVSVSKTFAVFKFCNPTGTGATANVGWLLGQTRRCRVYQDATGFFCFPMGRAYGRVIVRPSAGGDPCALTYDGVTWPTSVAGPCWPAVDGPWHYLNNRTFGGDTAGWTGFTLGTGSSTGQWSIPVGGGNIGSGQIVLTGSWNNIRTVASTLAFYNGPINGIPNTTTLAAGSSVVVKIDGYTYMTWGAGTNSLNSYISLPSIPVGATVPLRMTVDVVITAGSTGNICAGILWQNAFTP